MGNSLDEVAVHGGTDTDGERVRSTSAMTPAMEILTDVDFRGSWPMLGSSLLTQKWGIKSRHLCPCGSSRWEPRRAREERGGANEQS
jgi:hypothetical protein